MNWINFDYLTLQYNEHSTELLIQKLQTHYQWVYRRLTFGMFEKISNINIDKLASVECVKIIIYTIHYQTAIMVKPVISKVT